MLNIENALDRIESLSKEMTNDNLSNNELSIYLFTAIKIIEELKLCNKDNDKRFVDDTDTHLSNIENILKVVSGLYSENINSDFAIIKQDIKKLKGDLCFGNLIKS